MPTNSPAARRRTGTDARFDDLEVSDNDAPVATTDPGTLAACVLLRHALASAGLAAGDVSQDGTVCLVLVPGPEWQDAVCEAWSEACRHGVEAHSGEDFRAWGRADGWAAWLGGPRARSGRRREDAFGSYVAAGFHCAGFAAAAGDLPDDLVELADFEISLARPTAEVVGEAIAEICLLPATEKLSAEHAALLTPRAFQLARRPGQSPDEYVVRLRAMLERRTGRAAARPAPGGSPRDTPTLDRLHGMDEAVEWGTRLARDIALVREGKLGLGQLDRGALLSGPPGCGKTLFARALAETCRVPLITGSYGEWHGSGSAHQGDFLKAMHAFFERARAQRPCVAAIDEVDSFPNRSTLTHQWADYEIQVVNALLAEMDGVVARDGVVVLGLCNNPHLLDPALTRSGRLDRHVRVRLPDRSALERILREHLGADLPAASLVDAALLAEGSSGADCERFVRGARSRARHAERGLELADLVAEIGGPARPAGELRLIATHEAGHAVALSLLRPETLLSVTTAGGGMTSIADGGGYLHAGDIGRQLTCLLAGRAAEAVLLGEPSSGAGGSSGSDLALATRVALMAVHALGFDATAGLAWRGVPDTARLPEIMAKNPEAAVRVRGMLAEAYEDALELARRRRAAVEAVADALLIRRALDRDSVAAIVAAHAEEGDVP